MPPILGISGYLVIAVLWVIPVLAFAAYFLTRRRLRRSRSLIWFDSVVIIVGFVIFFAMFLATSTRQSAYEERLMAFYTVPLAISVIFVPLLVIAAVIRYCIFSKPPDGGMHAP